jgi:hypothetical protein
VKASVATFMSGLILASPAVAVEIMRFSIDDMMTIVRPKEIRKDDISFYHDRQDVMMPIRLLGCAKKFII